MFHRHAAFFCLVLALPAFTGCAAAPPPHAGPISPHASALVVEVDNLNWWDMEVELDAEGTQYRLGIAPSYGRVRFRVSSSKLGGASYFRLVGNPMNTGSTAFAMFTELGLMTTPEIDLAGRRNVQWTVGSAESTTRLVVR